MAFTPVTITDEQKASLEEKHEDILICTGDPEFSPWLVVVRRPTRQETIGFKAHAKKDETTANEQLVRRIAVFPSAADLDRQIERWPLLCDGISGSDKFRKFLGFNVEASLK